MRRSQADSTNRSLAAFGKLQHIRPRPWGSTNAPKYSTIVLSTVAYRLRPDAAICRILQPSRSKSLEYLAILKVG